MRSLVLTALALLGATASAHAQPGPSRGLFNRPYYSCVKNYYVSTTGSDANDGSSAQPWLTLQHANDVGRMAGDCVNVLPGTYAKGVMISNGGNLASPTGYVVYRCTEMDACTITDVSAGGQNGAFVWNMKQPMTGNYIMIDGFKLEASQPTLYGQGIEILNGSNTWQPSVHHIWILNSVISGYGQSGVQMNQGEYFFVVHNRVYGNSGVGCAAQGSGISFNELKAFPDYVRTPDDSSNRIVGNIGTAFHNVVADNDVYNNAVTSCGSASNPYDTDGNNIIMDTLNWNNQSGTVPYTGGVLIDYNLAYNGGGGGIHILASEDVTVANNSCYNSWLDPYNSGSGRGCLDSVNSYNNNFFNNISVAIPADHTKCAWTVAPYAMWNDAFVGSPPSTQYPPDTFTNNISYVIGSSCQGDNGMWNGDTFSCTSNQCKTNPLWVGVGNISIGSETTKPQHVNFALQADSPAIGRGATASYLPSTSVDIGACPHSWKTCQ